MVNDDRITSKSGSTSRTAFDDTQQVAPPPPPAAARDTPGLNCPWSVTPHMHAGNILTCVVSLRRWAEIPGRWRPPEGVEVEEEM